MLRDFAGAYLNTLRGFAVDVKREELQHLAPDLGRIPGIETTANLYTHLSAELHDVAAEKRDALLGV
jgi:hypothetical protein